jgi:hypothetical protein
MLERHVKRKLSELFKQALRTGTQKVPKIEVSQVSMEGFVVPCPTFEQCLLNWAVETYQPLRCCEERTFRYLCLALNKRCPILSRDKLHMNTTSCQYDLQGECGWQSLLEGFIHKDWSIEQHTFYSTIQSPRNGKRWTIELIKKYGRSPGISGSTATLLYTTRTIWFVRKRPKSLTFE